EQMTTATVLEGLHGIKEAPWTDLKGKPLNDRGLATRLRQYGVRSKDLNVGGDIRRKGYTREDLHDAWERYLAPAALSSDRSATSATGATKPDFQGSSVADVADTERSVGDKRDEKNADKTSKVADVADVALVAGDRAVPSDYDAVLEELAAQGQPTNGFPLQRCDHCGQLGATALYDWPHRPGGITLHSSCEAPWFDSEARQ